MKYQKNLLLLQMKNIFGKIKQSSMKILVDKTEKVTHRFLEVR